MLVGLSAGLWGKYLKTAEQQLMWVLGILAAVLSLQLRAVVAGVSLTPKLAELERSLRHPELFQFLVRAINSWESCQKVSDDPVISKFFRECLEQMTHSPEWTEVLHGRAIFGETRELALTAELLEVALKSVDAVSFGDEEFWNRAEGNNYLAETERVIAHRRLKVTRIFVLTKEQLALQKANIENHGAKGIECYILDPNVQVQMDREDFVIYDDKAVRYARPLPQSGLLKTAYLSVEKGDLKSYRNRFDQMKRRSMRPEKYFATPSEGTPATEAR